MHHKDVVRLFNGMYDDEAARFSVLPGITPNWPPRKLVALYEFVNDPKKPQDAIAKELGVDRSTISRKVGGMDWKAFGHRLEQLCTMSISDFVKSEATEYKKDKLAREAKKSLKNEIGRAALMEALSEKIMASVDALKPINLPITMIKPRTKGDPEHMVLLLSDMHVGLEFSLADTGNINKYDLQTFVERITNLKHAVVEILSLHQNLYSLPVLHILGLGDMVQGSNLAGEWGPAYSSSTDIAEQAIMAANAIADLVNDWSRYFKEIHVRGVVGNHGRAGASKNSDKVSANWDNIVYEILQARCSSLKNVTVKYDKAFWMKHNVNGTEFMLIHGDFFGSSSASLIAESRKLQDMVTRDGSKRFDVLVLGHFHTYQEIETTGGTIFVNGSFVGGDMHSLHHMRTLSKPTQTLMGVHPKRGITWKYTLDLAAPRTVTK